MSSNKIRSLTSVATLCLIAILAVSAPAVAQLCDQTAKFSRPIPLGISGGNTARIFANHQMVCEGGTLGSMVQDASGKQYILSNNHVLARSNRAARGTPIVQPGIEENPCVQAFKNAVARLSNFVKIGFLASDENTVDAALAQVLPGDVSPTILNIGNISSAVVGSPLGMLVQKMGRTSCVTQGTVTAVGVNITVDYTPPNLKTPRIANFVNQIMISAGSGAFAAPGDSGSLVLSTDPCPRPVGLLFAGGTGVTFANPISDVLSDLNVQFVGTCTNASTAAAATSADNLVTQWAGEPALRAASAIRDTHAAQLMKVPGAVGTGVGLGDVPGTVAIEVYVKKLTPEAQAAAPGKLDGASIRLKETGEIFAY